MSAAFSQPPDGRLSFARVVGQIQEGSGYLPCERFCSDTQPVRAHACTMRYFFQLEDGVCIRDPTGEEFADDAAAMREASNVARELSKARVHAHEWSVVVKDADGLHIGSVPLEPDHAPDARDVSVPPGSMH